MVLAATSFQLVNPSNYSPGPYPAAMRGTNEIDVAPELDCPDQTAVDGGEYTVQIVGTSMTLTAVRDDSCPFREGLLVVHPWQRKA